MFEKLLSQLPYNPGLIYQMAFYSRRLREEASIRRTGLIFLVLAFMVQFFAVFSPPQVSTAASNNDLINGGISSRSDTVNACNSNLRHYQDILDNYGISCSDVARASTVSLRSTDYNRGLFSMGRLPYGKQGETPVNINGVTYFWRYLWSWDSGPYSTYQALSFRSSATHKLYFILFSCGNLVTIGLPSAYQPPPVPKRVVPKPVKVHPPPTPPTVTPPPTPSPPPPSPPPPCIYDTSLPASSSLCIPCIYNNSILSSSSECKPCEASLSSQDTQACITVHKTASNITQGISDANNTTAQPGDSITYTLYAENKGKANLTQYTFQESLSDVMDYADPIDLHGGNMNSNDVVTWPSESINAGATVSHQITVKVKDPIPSNPVDPGDPSHFDLIMTNVYGNTININVPSSPVKAVETTTTSLPNTGPGASLFIAGALVIICGYFFSRARLLSDESTIAVQDNSGGLN